MEDRERIAKELYEFAGRYGAHQGTLWGIAGDKIRRDYLEEAGFLLDGVLHELGYTRQPVPKYPSPIFKQSEPLRGKFWQAIKDAQEGKPLDLTGDEFELFSAIEVLGIEQAKPFESPNDKVEAVVQAIANLYPSPVPENNKIRAREWVRVHRKQVNEILKLFPKSEPVEGDEELKERGVIEDGFGSSWSVVCPRCGDESMYVVRPGKVQCSNCD